MKEKKVEKTVYESMDGRVFENMRSCLEHERAFVFSKMQDEVSVRLSADRDFYNELKSPYLRNGVDVFISLWKDENRFNDIVRALNSVKNKYEEVK